MRTWTPPILALILLVSVAMKPRSMLRLIGYVLTSALLLAATTALAGWLVWEAILYLIRQSQT